MQAETTTALELFEQGLTKGDIKSMANIAVESVLENGNVLQVAEALSAMTEFVEAVKKDDRFKAYVRDETSKYPKGHTSNSGAKIECIEAGIKYDYSKCGDYDLTILEMALMTAEAKVNERKAFIKNLPIGGVDLITSEGESIHVYPPIKTSTSSYKITLAK